MSRRVAALLLVAMLILLVTACLVPAGIATPTPDGEATTPSATPPPAATAPPAAPPPAPVASPTPATTIPVAGALTVHFIDVGQADAILFQGPDFTILVDAGRHDRDDVLPYLRSVGVEHLDLLVGTHPHADHIGQFPQVLQALPVTEVWLSGDQHTTRTFERALDAILASDAGYHEPRAGEVFDFGSLRVEVLHPERLTGELHDGSISLRIVYGEVAFVLTGDAETNAEMEMLARGHELSAQILKLGHHGSRTSTSAAFLAAVAPEVAIYSAALGNEYGHPHAEVLARLEAAGIPVYGTDQRGTIRVITDGQRYELAFERGATSQRHGPSRAGAPGP